MRERDVEMLGLRCEDRLVSGSSRRIRRWGVSWLLSGTDIRCWTCLGLLTGLQKQPGFLRVPWMPKAPWRCEVGTVGLGDCTSSYQYCHEVCVFPLLKVLQIFYWWIWHHNSMEEALSKKKQPLSTRETLSGNVMKSGENYYLPPLFRKSLA